MTPLALEWLPRADALAPQAALAEGEVAQRLLQRLLRFNDEALSQIAGVRGQDWLCILAERERLPWVEGIQYLGRDPEATALLVPTAHRPNVPLALLQRALLRRFPEVQPPLALCAASERLLSLGAAVAIERAWLGDGPR